MTRKHIKAMAILAIALLSCSSILGDSSRPSSNREEITITWPEKGVAAIDPRILERRSQTILIAVDSIEDVTVELAENRERNSIAPPEIVYKAIHRGQPLILVQVQHDSNNRSDAEELKPSNSTSRDITISWRGKPAETFSADEAVHWRPEAKIRKLADALPSHTVNPAPAIRLPITESGIYLLPFSQIATSLDTPLADLNETNLALHHGGRPVPIELISTQELATSPDSLLFYGTSTFTDYTKTNVFWLTLSSESQLQIQPVDGTPRAELTTPTFFPETIHGEEDLHIWQTMARGEGQDHWFWGDKLTAPEKRDYILETPFPDESQGDTSIRVKYHGLTFSSLHHPDHQAQLFLNNSLLGDHFWDDRNPTVQLAQFPHSQLINGTNTITIGTPGIEGVVVDQIFINWIEIDYDRRFVASEDHLAFRSPEAGEFTFNISGIESESLDILNVTDLYETARIQNAKLVSNEGAKALRFSSTTTNESEFLVQTSAARISAPTPVLDSPSHWRSTDHGADYIVITHEEFTPAANRLAEYRQTQNLRAVTVQIQDIYDEFSHGQFDPQAIRDFLSYAYHHWQAPAPKFVVLLGDAYLDYHDNLKTGSINYIPSQQINTELLGLTVTDNWYAQVDGDDKIPDLLLGRIPVRNATEATRVVNRIIRYETNPVPGDWNTRIGLIADDDSDEFVNLSNELAAYVPQSISTSKWYAGEVESPTSTGVINIFNSGHSLITYTGHGTISSWGLSGNGSILLTSNLTGSINTAGQWPIVTVANCLNGFFAARHSSSCLAESLLSSKHGGAIAVWAPTSLGFPEGHQILMNEFYRQLFEKREMTLGAATTAALIATFVHDPIWLELMETYVLFGDPALKINLNLTPKQPNLIYILVPDEKLNILYETFSDLDYQVLSSDSLGPDASWSILPGAPHNIGSISIPIDPSHNQQYFRVEVSRKTKSPTFADQ